MFWESIFSEPNAGKVKTVLRKGIAQLGPVAFSVTELGSVTMAARTPATFHGKP